MDNSNSAKLFVGMLSKDCVDTDVESMFSPFGNITECAVLRDSRGNSKGCAFITFESTEEANAAIAAMHGSTRMDGCKANIVVKYADNEKQKQLKHQEQVIQESGNGEMDNHDTKLFIGMIGNTINEEKLQSMFTSYGTIMECAILRDNDGKSKGCGFVRLSTISECMSAIKGMHNSVKLPGANSSIVVKFADTDKQRQLRQQKHERPGALNQRDPLELDDTKIFVGMLGNMDKVDELRDMFSPFGQIIDCAILKDGTGRTKGCGFIRFSACKEAYTAIRVMNGSEKMAGASAKLVVKFADNKRAQQHQQPSGNFGSMNMNQMGMPEPMSMVKNPAISQLLQQQLALTAAAMSLAGGGGPAGNQFGSNQGDQFGSGLGGLGGHGGQYNSGSGNQYGSRDQFNTGGNRQPMPPPPPSHFSGNGGNSLFGTNQFSNNDYNKFDDDRMNQDGCNNPLQQALSQGQQALTNPAVLQQAIAQQQAFIQQALVAQQFNQPPSNHTQNQQEPSRPGPDGCNLFVMHLPKECSDQQLRQLFSPFGNVLSANIFYDKVTNESKCFGFVSFDEQSCAQNAIKSMNGFQIGGKRLKVQLKTNKKPY